jgi:hypothetical protein
MVFMHFHTNMVFIHFLYEKPNINPKAYKTQQILVLMGN